MDSSLVFKDPYNPNFYIGHKKFYANHHRGSHYHDSYEIYFTLTDGYRYVVGDRLYPFQSGDIYVFNQHDIHHTIFADDTLRDIYVVHFNPQFVRELSTPRTNLFQAFNGRGPGFSHRVHTSPKQTRDLIDLFQKAIHYYESNGYGYETYQKIILAEILLAVNVIYQSPEAGRSLPFGGAAGEMAPDKVDLILDYIHAHIGEDISMDHLAKVFYLSKDYLGKIFKKATGYTVKEYIMSKRMMFAKQYLLENESILGVMEKTGFTNYTHFISTFKNAVGVTPKQFVKKEIG